MSLVVQVPLTDPTLRPATGVGERLLDANRRLVARVGEPAGAAALVRRLDAPATNGQAERCLQAAAAGRLLHEHRSGISWLRAIGAMLRAISADDPGVRASLDDIELLAGTTERSADVAAAASATTLFDPELRATAEAIDAAGSAELVVDTDQQLPAAFRLVQLAGPRRCRMSGRFVVRHQETLGRTPQLAGVVLVPRVRQRVLRAEWLPGTSRPPCFIDRAADCPAESPWLGWLDAAEVPALAVTAPHHCAALVITVARMPSLGEAVGVRGVPVDLRPVLAELTPHIPVGVELMVGAPGVDLAGLRRAVEVADAAGLRLVGFRPFRPPVELPAGRWDGRPVRWRADPELDLPRWARPGRPDEATAGLLAELLDWARPRPDLLPGRVAGALLVVEHWTPVTGRHAWDPAAVPVHTEHVGIDGQGPGDFLVNLRTGQVARLRPRLGALLGRLRAGGAGAEETVRKLPEAHRTRLWTALAAVGAVRPSGSEPRP